MAIQYLTYAEIDLKKWDDCILRANNGLIYAYSFYLNQMAPNWDALVMDDYDAVMPLTWNKKYGIHYLYQPAFTASLGVFGKDIDASKLNAFLNAIPDKFKYWDICLNHQNCFPVADFTLYERVNYVLPLQQPYEILFSQFRESTQRNIKKSKDLNCVIKKNIAAEDIISLSQTQALKFDAVTNEDFKHIGNLYSLLLLLCFSFPINGLTISWWATTPIVKYWELLMPSSMHSLKTMLNRTSALILKDQISAVSLFFMAVLALL